MTTAHAPAPRSDAKRRRGMLVAAFGTIIEWYDFSIFFYTATSLTTVFFAGREDSLLLTLGVGAAGFLFRPLGAMFFGNLGDRIGRKATLIISTTLIALSMIGTALLPSHETAGIWGGIGMIVLRCLAGFSVGAEYTGIMVYLVESAKPGKRGMATSWAVANSGVGSLLAVGAGALTANLLTQAQMDSWGWRLLFVFGGLIALLMIPLRRLMEETESFERVQKEEKKKDARSPLVEAIVHQWKAILLAFALSTVGTISYFMNITYVPTYLQSVTHLSSATALTLGTIAAVVSILVTPAFGWMSDHVGRRTSYIILLVVFLVTTIPAYLLLAGTGKAGFYIGVALLAIPATGWSVISVVAIPEQFTALGRFAGMAIGYNVATAVFGGFSPFIGTWLIGLTGDDLAPAIYATVVILVAGIPAIIAMRDMTRRTMRDIDREPRLDGAGLDPDGRMRAEEVTARG